jgi:CRP/FNR family cyclic AMP-dependent transcriptional regulator
VLKGDLQIVTISEPGALFGELSVLLDIPHTATIKTLTPSRVYVVERASEFLQSHTDIAYQLAKLLAQRLHGMTTYLVDLKSQFADHAGHLGMVDEILGTLVHQQAEEECTPGSERNPTTTL